MDLTRSFYLHNTKRNHAIFEQLDKYAKIAKRMYNMMNYDIRQWYEVYEETLSYFDLVHIFQHRLIWKEFIKTDMADITLKMFYGNFQAWFEAMKSYKRNPTKFKGFPQIPNFLSKEIKYYHFGVRRVTLRENQLFITKDFHLPIPEKQLLPELKKTVEYTSGKKTYVKQVRFYPRGKNHYKIEMVYETEIIDPIFEGFAAGIDLNLDNLAIISNNTELPPLLFNQKPLKSYNQWWNKERAKVMGTLKIVNDKHISNRLYELNYKRDQFFQNYIHQMTTSIINICKDYRITHLIMGHNKDQKQNIDLGKRVNQKFVCIPFDKIRSQLKYKCELNGIRYEDTEESYTSKTDHLAYEPLSQYGNETSFPTQGKRMDRLFHSSVGKLLHADINGAIGIMRKILGDICIQDCLDNKSLCNPMKIAFRAGQFDTTHLKRCTDIYIVDTSKMSCPLKRTSI
jgi:putative transposase